MKKTLIFIDGQNLFYALKDMRIQERDVHWSKFFRNLLIGEDELIRAYWYQPQKLSEPRLAIDGVKRFVLEEDRHKRELFKEIKELGLTVDEEEPILTDRQLQEKAEELLRQAQEWHREQVRRYERQLHRYDELAILYPEIEMVRRGIVKINVLEQKYIGEKGLDVAVAVNMIKLHDKCDKLILISGDLDYAEAIQFIKDNLKIVHIVRLFRGQPPVNRSVSRTLMALADKVIDVYETEIREKFLN